MKVGLLLEKPRSHQLEIIDHCLAEVVKLCQKDVVESVTVLPDLLRILLLHHRERERKREKEREGGRERYIVLILYRWLYYRSGGCGPQCHMVLSSDVYKKS